MLCVKALSIDMSSFDLTLASLPELLSWIGKVAHIVSLLQTRGRFEDKRSSKTSHR